MATVILLLLILYDKFGKHKGKLYFYSFLLPHLLHILWPSLSHFKFRNDSFQECHFVNFSKLLQAAMPFTEKAGWTSLLSFPLPSRKASTFLMETFALPSYFFSQASLGAGVSGFPHCNKFSQVYHFEKYPRQYYGISWLAVHHYSVNECYYFCLWIPRNFWCFLSLHCPRSLMTLLQIALWSTK